VALLMMLVEEIAASQSHLAARFTERANQDRPQTMEIVARREMPALVVGSHRRLANTLESARIRFILGSRFANDRIRSRSASRPRTSNRSSALLAKPASKFRSASLRMRIARGRLRLVKIFQ